MNARSLRDKSVSSTILVLVIFLAACATPPPGIEPPKISIANIAPKDMTLFEQRFDVQLRIQNPNETELGLNGMRFEIDLNEKEFATGMTGEKVVVPPVWLPGPERRGHHRPQQFSPSVPANEQDWNQQGSLSHQGNRLCGEPRHVQTAVR